MPEVVSCPKCQRKSRVPDALVGKKVKCPGCAEIFVASKNGPAAAPKPAPPPRKKEEDEEGDTYEVVGDKKKRRRNDDDDEDERVSDKPRARRRSDDDDDDDDKPRTSRTSRDDDDDDDDDERVSRRRRFSRDDEDDDDEDDDDDDDDRPTRRRRRGGRGLRADWLRIHRGLTMIMASVFIQIGLVIVSIIGMFAIFGMAFAGMAGAMGGGPGGPPGAAVGGMAGAGIGLIILGLLVILGGLAALALRITGHVFCLPSPDAYGSRGLAVATLALMLTNLGCTILNYIITFIMLGSAAFRGLANPMAMSTTGSALANVISWIGALAGLGAFFVFLFYLRSLAQATGYEGLARNIITYVITVLVAPIALCILSCVGGMIAGAGMAAAMNPQRGGGGPGNPAGGVAAMGALGFVCIGMWVIYIIAMAVWWLIILIQTRTAVGSRLRG